MREPLSVQSLKGYLRHIHLFTSPKSAEELAHVVDQQVGRILGSMVAATLEFRPLHDVFVVTLGEAPDGNENNCVTCTPTTWSGHSVPPGVRRENQIAYSRVSAPPPQERKASDITRLR